MERTLLSKMLTRSNILNVKLSKHWERATIRQVYGEMYIVETSDGQMRKVHYRQMKRLRE